MLRVQVGPFGAKRKFNQSNMYIATAFCLFPLAPPTCIVGDELVFNICLHVYFHHFDRDDVGS